MSRENHKVLLISGRLTAIVLLVLSIGILSFVSHKTHSTSVANPDGDLRINITTGHNFIVDSNVESPSTYAPNAVYIGAQFCNDGMDTLTQVLAYIGDFDGNTPGIYPSRTHTGLTGTFFLTHEGGSGGTKDATRYLPQILPGECVNQFWLVSYPTLDDNGDAVTQGIKPDDDLWLEYDIWATANDSGVSLAADDTRKAFMRNEISAMANKIWPNGDNKVPNEYKEAIEETLGWSLESSTGNPDAYPGESFTLQGIWYDLGNIGQGFDNNGDFIPDKNIWMQPVGDAEAYNPDCFRLLGMYGLLIIKLTDGTEQLIPFKDETYFESIPEKNNGGVGLVYYSFAALDGPCSGNLTPYQAVASGNSNEKFNGDFGHYIPLAISKDNAITFDKNVDLIKLSNTPPDTLIYTLTANNIGTVEVGSPFLGAPLVIEDSIPNGTVYLAGSAAVDNILPVGVPSYTILYSTNNGATWVINEPPAANVTNIRWLLDAALPAGESVSFTLKVSTGMSSTEPIICNSGISSFGFGNPFSEDKTYTLALGNNSLGDKVWEDDGGTTGIKANGIQDGDENGIINIELSLFFDFNENGVLDDNDFFLGKDTTDTFGNYLFADLPDGNFIVTVCDSCVINNGIPTGWGITTVTQYSISLDTLGVNTTGVSSLEADFGFSPILEMEKQLISETPAYEGQLVYYKIDVQNLLQLPDGSAEDDCRITAWAGSIDNGETNFAINETNAIGLPDETFANGSRWNNFAIAGNNFNLGTQTGNIAQVELLFQFYSDATVVNEEAFGRFQLENTTIFETPTLTINEINSYAGINNTDLVIFDVTTTQAWTWGVFDATWWTAFVTEKNNAGDGALPYIDAIGVRITPESCNFNPLGEFSVNSIDSLPLVDNYDASKLKFIAASIIPDTIDEGTGIITWNNLGLLNAKKTKSLIVTFQALEPLDLVNGDTTDNIANITNGTLVSGTPTNEIADTAGLRTLRAGTISGYVWSDGNSNGWQGTTGYEGGEDFVPNATIVLHSCDNVANNGSCNGTETTDTIFTDENGYYLFEGLVPNLHYYVEIVESSLPGSINETGDPDDDPNRGTGNGNTCGSGGSNAKCDANWDNDGAWFEISVDTWGTESWDPDNINFGYEINPTIYGNVWEDIDGDGIQETGETGIVGVTVELQHAGCTAGVDCPTTTTDADGNYEFVDLTAGINYAIIVGESTLPAVGTWTETAETDGTINNSISVTPASSEISGSHNFGYTASGTAAIGDTLFYDYNGDGIQDANEEGIIRVTLSLYKDVNGNGIYDTGTDALIDTTSTDANGQYLFTDLAAGDYIVIVEEGETGFPSNVTQSADPDETGGACTTCDAIGAGTLTTDTLHTVDFGYQPFGTGIIGDLVWYDANGDSMQLGATEIAIDNVTVELWIDFNMDGTYVLLSSQITDENGNYLFENLPDGDYKVIIDSTDTDIPQDVFGNTYNPSTATAYDVILMDGSVSDIDGNACIGCDLNMDFGFVRLGSIGDMIFWDANSNGEQDWNEEGIADITVYLLDDMDIKIDSITTSDGTDGNVIGYYIFTGLKPADYTVQVNTADPDLNGGTLIADPSADGVPCTDPTAFECNNQYTTTINYGTNFAGADFGYQPSGVIGDYVWFDQNGDGIQGGGENGLGDVRIILTNQSAVTIDGVFYAVGTYKDTTYTDLDGGYIYQNMPDGTYTVEVETPTSMSITSGAESVGTTSTTVIMSGGSVTSIGGTGCTDCDLNIDFGFELSGPHSLSGSICLDDDMAQDGVCGGVGDSQLDSVTVYLYNDDGDYLGSTLSDVSGNYSFGNLPTDTYIVAIGTTDSPFDIADLTTTAANTPATSLTEGALSTYQTVPVNSAVTGVDFAYELVIDLDFGDLPDFYKTTLGVDGARHIVPTSPMLYLGSSVDTESDGQPNTLATGDGTDENGVTFLDPVNWAVGTDGGSLQVMVNGNGYLVGWIDFGQDSSFVNDIIIDTALTTGTYTLTFDIPTGTTLTEETFYARFRYFPTEPAFPEFAFTGMASDGEVEDYQFDISANMEYDYGDLPDIAMGTTGITDYETYDSTGGPKHLIIPGLFLGDTVDIDTDGIPNNMAMGDDTSNVDDEDGLIILPSLDINPGQSFRLPLSVTNTTGDTAYVKAWIDWNGDGDFMDTNEAVISLKDSTNNVFPSYLEINTPNDALSGSLLGFRVRLSNEANLGPNGSSNSGEVEDYLLGVQCPQVCVPINTELKRE